MGVKYNIKSETLDPNTNIKVLPYSFEFEWKHEEWRSLKFLL